MTSLTKKGETQNQKIFFRCKLRLIFAESFEGLNSSQSLAQSTGDLWSCKVVRN